MVIGSCKSGNEFDFNKNPIQTAKEYCKWFEEKDNNQIIEKEMSTLNYKALFVSAEYLAMKEIETLDSDTSEIRKKIDNYSELQYVVFRIKKNDFNGELLKFQLKSSDEYQNRINYCSFNIQKDFNLIEGKDTLNCCISQFERTYGITPFISFILGFPKTEANQASNKTLVFNDMLFGNGIINLTYHKENFNKLPQLKL